MSARSVFLLMCVVAVCSVFVLLFFGVGVGSAQDGTATFHNPLQYDSLLPSDGDEGLLFALVDGLTIALMPLVVLAIAYIGFRMAIAGREKTADYTRWKNAFAMALIGLFLILGTRGILYIIKNTVEDVLGEEYVEDILGE